MEQMPMFPLGTVLLPGERLPLRIFEPRYVELVRACMSGGAPEFGVVLIARGREVGGGEQRTEIGTVARIVECAAYSGNRFRMLCTGTERIRVVRWLDDDPYPLAEVRRWPDEPGTASESSTAEVVERAEQLHELHREFAARARRRVPDFPALPTGGAGSAYELAAQLPLTDTDRQAVLAAADPAARMTVLANALDDVIAALRFRLS